MHASVIAIGPHRLLCGDLTDDAVRRLMGDERADVVYSDPPWGPGNQQYWHTMCERGSKPRTSWPEFLAAFCSSVATYRAAHAPVFVEMGLRWEDELVAAMRSVGLERRFRWRTFYGPKKSPNENLLSVFGPALDYPLLERNHGEPMTREILGHFVRPGDIVLDPCTGKGMTARVTHLLGGVFRGSEMNPARLERTASWLRARAHAVP